jgi:hypothetical protein
MSKKNELKGEILEDLNQILIKMKKINLPELDEDYETSYGPGFIEIPVDFKNKEGKDLTLNMIKVVLEAITDNLSGDKKYDIEKLARAYYSSFCNA